MSDLEQTYTTPFDEMIQSRELNMLKTVVPYVPPQQKNQMVMLIQLLQFRHTYQLMKQGPAQLSAAALPEGTDRRSAMLSDLRKFCTPREQELIDNLIQMFTILDNYNMVMN